MSNEILGYVSALFLGLGLLVEAGNLAAWVNTAIRGRTTSGVPVVPVIFYLIGLAVRAAGDVPLHGWWVLGLVVFHVLLQMALLFALRTRRS